MPLPLTVSCCSKIQIGFTFLVPAHPRSPGKRAVKRVCVCVCVSYRIASHVNRLLYVRAVQIWRMQHIRHRRGCAVCCRVERSSWHRGSARSRRSVRRPATPRRRRSVFEELLHWSPSRNTSHTECPTQPRRPSCPPAHTCIASSTSHTECQTQPQRPSCPPANTRTASSTSHTECPTQPQRPSYPPAHTSTASSTEQLLKHAFTRDINDWVNWVSPTRRRIGQVGDVPPSHFCYGMVLKKPNQHDKNVNVLWYWVCNLWKKTTYMTLKCLMSTTSIHWRRLPGSEYKFARIFLVNASQNRSGLRVYSKFDTVNDGKTTSA